MIIRKILAILTAIMLCIGLCGCEEESYTPEKNTVTYAIVMSPNGNSITGKLEDMKQDEVHEDIWQVTVDGVTYFVKSGAFKIYEKGVE